MGATANFKILTVSELATLRKTPELVEDVLFPEDVENPFEGQIDLEKSWHQLHFLLTGKLEPDGTAVGDAVLGGEEIGPELGYGRARIIEAGRVREIHQALSGLSFAQVFASLDKTSPLLAKVYLGAGTASEREYLEHYFGRLVALYNTASASGSAILAYLA